MRQLSDPVIKHEFVVDTSDAEFVDLTDRIDPLIPPRAAGLLNVFVPHATAGLAMIETGSGSDHDLIAALKRLFPRDSRYIHEHGSAGHGADHLLPALLQPSLVIPVDDGRMSLGMWQRVVLVDLNRDNPLRTVELRLLEG